MGLKGDMKEQLSWLIDLLKKSVKCARTLDDMKKTISNNIRFFCQDRISRCRFNGRSTASLQGRTAVWWHDLNDLD